MPLDYRPRTLEELSKGPTRSTVPRIWRLTLEEIRNWAKRDGPYRLDNFQAHLPGFYYFNPDTYLWMGPYNSIPECEAAWNNYREES